MASLKSLGFPSMGKPLFGGTDTTGRPQTNNGAFPGSGYSLSSLGTNNQGNPFSADVFGTGGPDPMPGVMGNANIGGFGGGMASPGVTAGTYSGTGMFGTPIGQGGLQATNNWKGGATFGPNSQGPEWTKYWNGDVMAIQGNAGKANLGAMNAMGQNQRDAQHRADSLARQEALRGQTNGDAPGGAMSLQQLQARAAADAASNADQLQTWQSSMNPMQLEGYPLENWSPQQLQAGLTFYQQQQAAAVPGSNEWNMYQDRINSLQSNLAGNRGPWSYPSQGGAGYFGNMAGTPPGGWNTGGGPRS